MNAVRTTALAAVHNQPVGRRYTVAEVKQIVYPLIEVIDNALLLEHKPDAGKRDIIAALNTKYANAVAGLPATERGTDR